MRRDGNALRGDEGFSAMRSCTTATASAAGLTRQRAASARRLSAGTFSNSVVTARHCCARKAGLVVIGRADVQVGDHAGRALLGRIEHGDLVAQALGGVTEHAAQLAAAQQAEPAAGSDGESSRLSHADQASGGTFMSRAACVWRARNATSF